MLKNYKKSIKRIPYSFAALLISISYLQASFVNEEILSKARSNLSTHREALPEVKSKSQHPNLAAIVSVEAISNFWKKANKVEAGISTAVQTVGVSRERSALFADIKRHNGSLSPQEKTPRVLKVPWVFMSWGQILTAEISELTNPLTRDQYIGANLNHLKTQGHRTTKEEEAYDITGEDLVRVEEAMSFAGNRLLYINGLREKAKIISFERNRQKEGLRQHQSKILPVFEELQANPPRLRKINRVWASWRQILTAEMNRLLYIKDLRKKAKGISVEMDRLKEGLRQHQTKSLLVFEVLRENFEVLRQHEEKILPVFEKLQKNFEERKILKQAYAEKYEGDRAIMIAYAQNKTVTLGELKRMGKWLQSDDVVYAVEEVPDLIHWMAQWHSYLEESEDEREVYSVSKKALRDLKVLQSTDSIEEPYMVNLLSLLALDGKTLREYVEETRKKLLPPEYLKTLMSEKNKVTVELKKRLEREESLAEQLLRPVTIYPRFVVAGASGEITDLSQSTVNLAQSGLMDSIVLNAPLVSQIQEEGAPSVSSSSFPYQMEMDPDNTYVYDVETRRYLPATSETVLPSLFIRMEKAVDKGWFYNARSTTLLVLGDSSGFVHVNEDDTTSRGFHILQKTETPFSLVKKNSAQVGTQVH